MKHINTKTLALTGCLLLLLLSFFLGNVFIELIVFIGIIAVFFYTKRDQILAYRAGKAYEKGNIPASFALYEKYLTTPKPSALTKIVYSYRLVENGELEKSYALLQSLNFEELEPLEKRNYNAAFALILFKKKNYSRAIELFEEIFDEKANELGYEILGYLYLCAKRYDQALAFNKKAYDTYGSNPVIQSNLGCSYYYKDLYPEAAEIFECLMDMHTPLLEPYYYYALMLDEQGDYQAALDNLVVALDKPEIYLHELKHEMINQQILTTQRHLKEAK